MAEGAPEYPWYAVVEGESLAQGDILREFPILVPDHDAKNGETIPTEKRIHDVVVMTQSCDIANSKIESLLVCPVWDFWVFVDAAEKASKEKGEKGGDWASDQRKKLLQGNMIGYHLINEITVSGLERGLAIIDFRELYSTPRKILKAHVQSCGKRIRLLPPYREHMSQAFARFFMRVGLPVDIDKEKLKRPAK